MVLHDTGRAAVSCSCLLLILMVTVVAKWWVQPPAADMLVPLLTTCVAPSKHPSILLHVLSMMLM
jgi:hypothetical protein